MAYIQRDGSGDNLYISVHQPVGLGKANAGDDVLLVQALLFITYKENPYFAKKRPTKEPAYPTTKLQATTPTLIAHYQKVMLKRPKPQGYINPIPTDPKHHQTSTLYRLFAHCDLFYTAMGMGDLTERLQADYPELRGLVVRLAEITVEGKTVRQHEYQSAY